ETDNLGQMQNVKGDAHARARQFRRQATAPELGQKAVAYLNLVAAFDLDVMQSAAPRESAALPLAGHPQTEPMPRPVIELPAQPFGRLSRRAHGWAGSSITGRGM